MIGPFRGGRSLAVAGVPGNAEKFYFGAVGGGVWETDNAGRTWFPIFDGVPTASIGAIAVAPSDPNVIYVGTGEADMRSDIQQGDGIYKSTNAGKTWTHIGLEDSRQIGRILVDPRDPNHVYVAALGHQYGPNEQRGVFVSTDGGATWDKTLYKDADTGATELAMDPADSQVIFAALWQTRRPPWSVYPPSNGPGSGMYKSTDSGRTWTQIQGNGLPSFIGKMGIAFSPSMPNRIYAIIDTNDDMTGGAYRSDDGGATWTKTDGESRIWHRGWYFERITADPKNPDTVYVMNTSTYRSTDGGKSFTPIKGAPGGDDYHEMWIEPDDPNRMILSSDQGTVISVDGAKTWSTWYNQPTAQIYHVVTDNRLPYWVYGAQQDSGAMAVPSRSMHIGISEHDWRAIDVGGESGTIAADPLHPGVLLGSTGAKEWFDTGMNRDIDPTLAYPDTVWRSEWTQPIVPCPTDPHVFYTSHQQIFRTGDAGATWKVISPDLTRDTNAIPTNLDPATAADHTGLPRNGVVYWIAPSPVKPHQIWAGTDDGYIWLTTDEGAHWQNVTPPDFAPWSKVGIIDASHFDADTAYAAIDKHRIDDNHPYIYLTHDAGKHWKLAVNGIPEGQFVNVVREDPKRKGLLYAGTDWEVFVSFDDGDHWQSLKLNMPAASVRDIAFNGSDIVIATHGRSIWILDDASVLRQLSSETASGAANLFKPDAAMLYQRAAGFGVGGSDEGTPLPPEEPQGKNPPFGAIIDYRIGRAETPVVFTISDSSGKAIRRISSNDKPPRMNFRQLDIPSYWFPPQKPISADPGGHRLVWDLRTGEGRGLLVPPGTYQVSMTVNNHSYSQPLTVVHDPRVDATDADLRQQYEFAQEVQKEIDAVQAAQAKAQELAKGAGTSSFNKSKVQQMLGSEPAATPDGGGDTPQDVSSFRAILGGLARLEGAVERGPGAPTPHFREAFKVLKARADVLVAEIRELSGSSTTVAEV